MSNLFKVIDVDNFNRDYQTEYLFKDNLTKEEADQLAKELNADGGVNSLRFFKVVPQDYKLYVFDGY
jgi:hypothetical protein